MRSAGWGLVIAAVLTGTALLVPKDGFWINDCGCKFLQVRSLVVNGALDGSIRWPGADIDPEFRCAPLRPPFGYVENGKLYAQYPPFFALVSSWLFRGVGTTGLYIMPLLGGLATLAGVQRLARLAFGRPSAEAAAVLIAGLATPLWFYSATFWEHTPATALTVWSVWCFCRDFTGRGRAWLVISASLLALATYFRSDTYLLAAVWAGVLLTEQGARRRFLPFLAAYLAACVPLWVYQAVAVGHPLGLHFRGGHPLENGWAVYFADRLTVVWNLLVQAHPNSWLSAAFIAPTAMLAAGSLLGLWSRFRTWADWTVALVATAGVGILIGCLHAERPMWALMSSNSLFAAAPVLALAFVRSGEVDSQTSSQRSDAGRAARWMMLVAVAHVATYCAVAPPLNTAGIHWGCRFLLPVYPLLAVLAGGAFAEGPGTPSRHAMRRVLLWSLAAVSFALQVYSVTLLFRRQASSGRLIALVAESPGEVVVTDGWFVPQELAPVFFDRPMFLATSESEWEGLQARLRSSGVSLVLFVYALSDNDAPPAGVRMWEDGLSFLRIGLETLTLPR